jgi:uncharacterized membrane protein YheB (UPF0754 family)
MIKTVGLFAVSGAITNWIAVHMLFEKVPGLYGSGVIPERFEDFKSGIRTLVMEQFFSEENIQRFIADNHQPLQLDLSPIIKKVDLAPTFDSLVEVVKASSFGQMLGMFGGVEALEPMRQPFIDKMGLALEDITQDPEFILLLQEELAQPNVQQDLHEKIKQIVEQRLNELTPKMVKDIIQSMIRKHLGWLVVWGGVFGGLIGLLATLFKF